MVESSNDRRFTNPRVSNGFDLQKDHQYLQQAKRSGYSSDAYILLRDKPDLRIRIQGILSEYFDRDINLKIEGGYLIPEMVDKITSTNYDLRENESHGLKELISILSIIHDDEPDIVIIDELELHLHPQYQKFLLQEIQRLSGKPDDNFSKTFFLITHSPTILDFRNINDMTNIYSFRDKSEPPLNVDEFSPEDEYHINSLIPRLNTQHKEALFSKKPVLVEGYTDEQIFSLAIEKHDSLRKNPSSTIVSVDGKENINAFFRFCRGLGLSPRIIADLDVLFEGNLRQTLSDLDSVKSRLQNTGTGSDLMDAIGSIESDLEQVNTKLHDRSDNCLPDSLLNVKDELNKTTKSSKQRYILYRAILFNDEDFYSEFDRDVIKSILGRMSTILCILNDCGYYILSRGELEDFLCEENIPFSGVNPGKNLRYLRNPGAI